MEKSSKKSSDKSPERSPENSKSSEDLRTSSAKSRDLPESLLYSPRGSRAQGSETASLVDTRPQEPSCFSVPQASCQQEAAGQQSMFSASGQAARPMRVRCAGSGKEGPRSRMHIAGYAVGLRYEWDLYRKRVDMRHRFYDSRWLQWQHLDHIAAYDAGHEMRWGVTLLSRSVTPNVAPSHSTVMHSFLQCHVQQKGPCKSPACIGGPCPWLFSRKGLSQQCCKPFAGGRYSTIVTAP